MHTLSKVLLGFVVVGAIAAFLLTMMLFDARGGWLQKVETRQADLEKLKEDVRLKELVVSDLKNEMNRRMTPWGRVWEIGPQAIQPVDANVGTLLLGLGTNAGLTVREASQGKPLPTVHLFGVNADGTSNYMGTFRLTAVEGDRASAQLIRQPLPGEVAGWQAPAGVRIWESIPSNWRALQADLQGQTAEALQDVVSQQTQLATQQTLIAKSQERLQRRIAELTGDQAPVEGADQDTLDGLVLALRKEETIRDEQLFVLNQFRHEFDAKYNELTDLLEQNRNLVRQLPQPEAETEQPAGPAIGDLLEPARRR